MESNFIPIQTAPVIEKRYSHLPQNYRYYLMHLSNPPRRRNRHKPFDISALEINSRSCPLAVCSHGCRELCGQQQQSGGLDSVSWPSAMQIRRGWDKQFDWEGQTEGLRTGRIILSIKRYETATN